MEIFVYKKYEFLKIKNVDKLIMKCFNISFSKLKAYFLKLSIPIIILRVPHNDHIYIFAVYGTQLVEIIFMKIQNFFRVFHANFSKRLTKAYRINNILHFMRVIYPNRFYNICIEEVYNAGHEIVTNNSK